MAAFLGPHLFADTGGGGGALANVCRLPAGWIRPLLTLLPTRWLRMTPCRVAQSLAGGGLRFVPAPSSAAAVLTTDAAASVRVLTCQHTLCIAQSHWASAQLHERWPALVRAAETLLCEGSGSRDGVAVPSAADCAAFIVVPSLHHERYPVVAHLSAALRTWHEHPRTQCCDSSQ